MILLVLVITAVYVLVLGWLVLGVALFPDFKPKGSDIRTKFTIVVPFRNEAKTLPVLLRSLSRLKYPNDGFELIFVDDDSEDDSLTILQQAVAKTSLDMKVLQNKRTSNSPKKDAITTALEAAKFEWILSTDADCAVPEQWLRLYDGYIQAYAPNMICGPVIYESPDKKVATQFQVLEGLSLQAVSMGAFHWKKPILSNGANMAYRRSIFDEVGGYVGNDHIASGDDIFLLEKIQAAFPGSVSYLKHKGAAVITQVASGWQELISQRLRWATKTSGQKSWPPRLLGLVVVLGNLAFILGLVGLFLNTDQMQTYMLCLLQKLFVDLLLITFAARLFQRPIGIFSYLLNAMIYPFISIWIFLKSFGGGYEWKGRTFRK